jgi:AcrR family transcriptional regulator
VDRAAEQSGRPSRPVRPLRADAVRNRDAIVAAAREVFADRGLDAPLEEVARRAGVGIGTLYRRFPTREQLIAAALMGKISEYADAAERALGEHDPWAGFSSFAERICTMQADNLGLAELLLITLEPGEQIEAVRARANRAVIALTERAKAAGQLRDDLAGEDLLLMLIASTAIAAATRGIAPAALSRFVALMLAGFRPRAGDTLPPPPTAAQMRRVMRRIAGEHGCRAPRDGPRVPRDELRVPRDGPRVPRDGSRRA